jgi:hypothetical protein
VEAQDMRLQAYQADLMGVGKGRVEGEDQILLRFQQRGGEEARTYALSLEDARDLMGAIAGLLVHEADQSQIIQSN